MTIPMVRKRLSDGTPEVLEPAFPEMVGQIDPMVLMMLEALAGQQEQIMQLQEEMDLLKGGNK